MSFTSETIASLAKKIKNREVKSSDAVNEALARIQKLNPELNAFISVNDKALERAEMIDREIASGKKMGRLAGVPIAVKDNFCTQGLRTTAASKILDNFIPPYSATVVEKLLAEGAVIVGKANLDEFAMGSSNENSAYGPVKNPWNTAHVPGGSSGGSTVAVTSKLCLGALGTDTGGSIRLPANYCGVVGLKPTYGRVSRYGIVAFASSLDQAGPITLDVRDSALLLETISGSDPRDSTTSDEAVPLWSENIDSSLAGIRIGLPKEYFAEGGIDSEVRATLETVINMAKSKGAKIVDVSLPLTKYSVATYYIIATSEASSNLARYDGVRFGHRAQNTQDLDDLYKKSRGQGFGAEVKRRIMIGTYALSSGYYDAYYQKACQVRRILQNDFLTAFQSCDVILGPVSTNPAFKIGERVEDPMKMYLNDIFTTSTNLAGLPGMSIPAGFSKAGLPIGVQLTAPHFEEQRLFNVARSIEENISLEKRAPHVI